MELDHVLIAVAELEAAAREIEGRYGLTSVEGGRHAGWGTANRIVPLLKSPAFEARFTAKGRYRDRMHRTPVRLLTHDEPGLLGAAIAFEREYGAADQRP